MTAESTATWEFTADAVARLVAVVGATRATLYRDFPWRRTSDPYEVLVSEVMLQQTQTVRVERHYAAWIAKFPTFDALAAASRTDVLEEWQGLGYNRRCLALHACAQEVAARYGGVLPRERDALMALPGIGPATAAGVAAFAFDEPAAYLETNVRTVVLHELWPDRDAVHDRAVVQVVEAASAYVATHPETGLDARAWNYALLDYGAWLKKTVPNPSRRSKQHTRQSAYEGSRRQKRAALLRALLGEPGGTARTYALACGYETDVAEDVLGSLVAEGFAVEEAGRYRVAD